MTDRMEPTMQLRLVRRKSGDPFNQHGWALVLQQLWSKYHPAYRGPMADGYFEWRDIPEVSE